MKTKPESHRNLSSTLTVQPYPRHKTSKQLIRYWTTHPPFEIN